MSDDDKAAVLQSEALREALETCEPGDIVEVHDVACSAQVDEPCDCDVLTIKVGEHQA